MNNTALSAVATDYMRAEEILINTIEPMPQTAHERALYTRQSTLELDYIQSAIVVGVGGVGFYVALFLAMSGVKELHLMDDDTLELSNRARLPYAEEDVGKEKTALAEEFLMRIRPNLKVETWGRADTLTLGMTEGDWLFDCTDQAKTQVMLKDYAKSRDISYIRAGYDGLHITVTSHPSGFTTDDDTPGYAVTPSWVVPASIVAGLAVYKAMKNPSFELSADLSEVIRAGHSPPPVFKPKPWTDFHIGQAYSRANWGNIPTLVGDLIEEEIHEDRGEPEPSGEDNPEENWEIDLT